ncbi:MAG: flagellar motor switch protein FliM [Candidatus Tectomicrobia bacterium]|uniref:Flagellar motor switch protein FliM n=1 Tax=Tectimicrobiota bacterium TaxID=2528274 RepID=A0A932FZM9_UNCTE|nr:flagellar motor switch protein FliM [Candidatus Tectomicrobia bacterium]
MAQVLSQEEVDALLQTISEGKVEAKPRWMEVPSGINRYDFARQHQQIFRGQMPTLRSIYSRFANLSRTSLGSILGRKVDMILSAIQIENFGEFLSHLPRPTSFQIFQVEALRCVSLIVLEGPLAYALFESFLGGGRSSSTLKIESRDFSAIEQRLISKVTLEIIMPDMEKAWQPVLPIRSTHLRAESNPQFVDVVSTSSLMATATFECKSDQPMGLLHFGLPYSNLEAMKDKLQHGLEKAFMEEEDAKFINELTDGIREVSSLVVAELGRTEINTSDLLNLKLGDIITLDKDLRQEVVVRIEGIPKFKGRLGVSQGNLAVQITNRLLRGGKRKDG